MNGLERGSGSHHAGLRAIPCVPSDFFAMACVQAGAPLLRSCTTLLRSCPSSLRREKMLSAVRFARRLLDG
eukprot:4102333-Prymnesium_polylepis.1